MIIKDVFLHLRLLKEVAECFKRTNLTIGLEKSKVCYKELRYLGFVIGAGFLKTVPRMVAAIQRIEVTMSPREVRRFLGTDS